MATPFWLPQSSATLVEELLPFGDEVGRLQYVELAILKERRRTRGGTGATR